MGFSKALYKPMDMTSFPPDERILTFAQTLRGGGVERAMLRLAAGWIAAGRRVSLVLGSDEGPLAAEIPAGIELVVLGDSRQRGLLALPRQVRALQPDVIFAPGNHYTGIAAWTRLRLGRNCPPIVAKVSNALVRPELSPGAARRYRRWLRLHPRFLDAVVAMTPAMAAEAVQEMGMPPEDVMVIPNPPALPVPGAIPTKLPEGRFLLGVGRLEPQKRWDRLIVALPRLADREIRLLILGEGSARAALEAQVAALGLRDRVLMPGHAGDPLPAIERAALVALTSDFEGVPGVLREALALGTPVVTTDSSVAVPEIVTSPLHGTIVPREDAAALVAALDQWLAPGRARPEPLGMNGPDPILAYLDLFGRVVQRRR